MKSEREMAIEALLMRAYRLIAAAPVSKAGQVESRTWRKNALDFLDDVDKALP